jgi:hypothetical protein
MRFISLTAILCGTIVEPGGKNGADKCKGQGGVTEGTDHGSLLQFRKFRVCGVIVLGRTFDKHVAGDERIATHLADDHDLVGLLEIVRFRTRIGDAAGVSRSHRSYKR